MKELPVKSGDLLADKYLVERVLGVGGMGVVVEAVHLELHEARAIKVMLPEALEEKDAVERFVREARAASRLKSEYVARVHDVGKLDNGLPYIVMEHLEGSDLRMLLKSRGRISVEEAVHYALQACEALAEAHSVGIIHRDLKPGNLFLTTRGDGSPCVKVLDFGISKQIGIDDEEMTKTHTVLGSPEYMSPEQLRTPRGVDARTDIWSLGVILYRLVTGELPFKGENITALVSLVLQSKPAAPSSLVPELPPEIDAVILRCLERDLTERWASVGELSAALLPFAPFDARASIERIARVLASAGSAGLAAGALRTSSPSAPGASSPKIPLPPRGSNDAWANTAFGSGTVALRRTTLAAAAIGVLLVGGVASMVIMSRLQASSSVSPALPLAAEPPATMEAPAPPAASVQQSSAPQPSEAPAPAPVAVAASTTVVASAPPPPPVVWGAAAVARGQGGQAGRGEAGRGAEAPPPSAPAPRPRPPQRTACSAPKTEAAAR